MSLNENRENKPVIPFVPSKKERHTRLQFDGFILDVQQHMLFKGQERVHLTSKPFEVLAFLVENHGQIVSKQRLLDAVWKDLFVTDDVLVKAVGEVRKVLEDNKEEPRFIQTVHREGYRFIREVVVDFPVVHRPEEELKPNQLTADATAVDPAVTQSSEAAPTFPSGVFPAEPDYSRKHSFFRRNLFIVVGALILFGLTVVTLRRPQQTRIGDTTEKRLRLFLSKESRAFDPDLSADAKRIVYVAEENGQTDLYLDSVAKGSAVRLTHDQALESDPDFSPDGERIVYARRGPEAESTEICMIRSEGGQPLVVVTEAGMPAWSFDGTKLVFILKRPREQDAVAVANADGTNLRILLRADVVYPFLRNPSWSPDGSQIIVVRSTGGIAGQLWLVPTKGGAPRSLFDDTPEVACDEPIFTADGQHVIYHSTQTGSRNLWMASLDGRSAVRLTTGSGPEESPSLAADGTIAFVSSRWRYALMAYDAETGKARQLFSHNAFLWAPSFSSDGREVAFSRGEADGAWHLWIVSAEGGTPRQLTSSPQGEIYPRFTSDGAWILYCTWSHPRRIWRIPHQGGQPMEVTGVRSQDDAFGDVSQDGQWVAFTRTDGDITRIYKTPLSGGEATPLLVTPSALPRWSPNGHWLAYAPDRSYSGGIFVARADGSNPRRLTDRGGWPVWWPDSSRLGYLDITPDGSQQIRVISVDGKNAQTLTHLQFRGINYPFDVSPDGEQIVSSKSVHLTDEIWLLEPPR